MMESPCVWLGVGVCLWKAMSPRMEPMDDAVKDFQPRGFIHQVPSFFEHTV